MPDREAEHHSEAAAAESALNASMPRAREGIQFSEDESEILVYEQMLMWRYAMQGVAPHGRVAALDRSALVLLSRLEASGPMTVGELAHAFDLDVSTVHRQVAAAMKAGLIERIIDPNGGAARKHRPTPQGLERLRAEFAARASDVREITDTWASADVTQFITLLRKFNQGADARRGKHWPRP